MQRWFQRVLIVLATLSLGIGVGSSALAATTTSDGHTSAGITFEGNTSSNSSSAGSDSVNPGGAGDGTTDNSVDIPNGKTPTGSKGDRITGKPAQTLGKTIHKTAADLLSGRLPQTGETQSVLIGLVGILLLLVIILATVVIRQARLLRERE